MPKKNPMLERIELKYKLTYEQLFIDRIRELCQLCQDAGMMAAHDVLGMGAGRCQEFAESYRTYINDMAHLINGDTDDGEYSRYKIEQKLQQICKENYEPWEVRYEKGTI